MIKELFFIIFCLLHSTSSFPMGFNVAQKNYVIKIKNRPCACGVIHLQDLENAELARSINAHPSLQPLLNHAYGARFDKTFLREVLCATCFQGKTSSIEGDIELFGDELSNPKKDPFNTAFNNIYLKAYDNWNRGALGELIGLMHAYKNKTMPLDAIVLSFLGHLYALKDCDTGFEEEIADLQLTDQFDPARPVNFDSSGAHDISAIDRVTKLLKKLNCCCH